MRNGMRAIHPGEILREEFLIPMNISASEFARQLKVPANRITHLLNEERAVTAETAMRLALALDTTAQFWMNLQSTYDLRTAEIEDAGALSRQIKKVVAANDASYAIHDNVPVARARKRR